jgi:hypothetical protein
MYQEIYESSFKNTYMSKLQEAKIVSLVIQQKARNTVALESA